jgi:hypothetical protein
LNRTVAFVSATLDGTPEDAAAILRSAEQRHGLRFFALPDNIEEGDQSDDWYE